MSSPKQDASPLPPPTPPPRRHHVAPGQTATYDISSLYDPVNDYQWSDAQGGDAIAAQWVYTFNICGNVNNPPTQCQSGAPPPLPNPPASSTNKYPAFQTPNSVTFNQSNPATGCYALGMSIKTGVFRTSFLSYIDPANPAYGVSYTYGPIANDDCIDNKGNPTGRQLSLVFRCAYNAWTPATLTPSSSNIDSTGKFVTETDNCVYQAYSWTTAGCPLECPVTNGALCSNKGICAWDADISSARCFCDDNYIEKDCSKPANPFPGGAVAGAFFGGGALGCALLLGTAFYLSRKAVVSTTGDGFYS